MYIWKREGIGAPLPGTTQKAPSNLRQGPPFLRFLSLDNFITNQATLTPVLSSMVDLFAQSVEASFKTAQPITTIRLIGHTDSVGEEKMNVDLGDRRAQAVADALKTRLKAYLNRVLIVVDPSPGETRPTANNATKEGRARNRRVEVFISTGVTVPPPQKPVIDWRKQAEEAAKKVEEQAQNRRRFNQPIPPPVKGRSISHWIDERLEGLPKWLAKRIRNAVLNGACALLEILFTQAGGRLGEKQKQELRKGCLDAANRSVNGCPPGLPGINGLGQQPGSQVTAAIRFAQSQMNAHLARYNQLSAAAGQGKNGTAARQEVRKYWEWAYEKDFLEQIKAIYEPQTGVSLNYRSYPVTKSDPATGRASKDTLWRKSAARQVFSPLEAGGSFCLGASRGMAFRSLFGSDRPSNRQVLTSLKQGIEQAKAAGNTDQEARLLISRIVSHLHDPGSMRQFNEDLASRYGIQNVKVRDASRNEAIEALKKGAPVIADLNGGWHWVLVQQSPRGALWANDPLTGYGVRRISLNELGSRFELIVDATTNEPIARGASEKYKK